jgi:two-component system phosphate regulon sensor histidine kinase PhoR
MTWRFGSLLIWQCVGGLLGWGADYFVTVHSALDGALIGVIVAGTAWVAVDLYHASALLAWIRRGDPAAPARLRGLWLDLQQRLRKALKENERGLAASEARLQDFLAAFQASPNGVVLLDGETRIEWFNQTAAAHFGFEPERDLEQHIGNLVREPEFASYLGQRDLPAIRNQGVLMSGRETSDARPVRLAVQLHAYGEGRFLLLSRDVTQLEQADAMRRDFVANVSHELRTPLTVVSGFVETLQSLPLEESQRQRYLGLIAGQAKRMQTLVSDLLALSRLEASPPVALGDWTRVDLMMRQVMHEARVVSSSLGQGKEPQHRIEFDNQALCENMELAGAASELQSAFANLVGNAVRYTPADGLIQVSWTLLPDGRAEFAVKDTGPGIEAEHVPRLTERFYRVDRSRSRDTGGTGLGLAIVKHVAQRHGATLQITSELGVGSTFTLVFPASRVRVMAETALEYI